MAMFASGRSGSYSADMASAVLRLLALFALLLMPLSMASASASAEAAAASPGGHCDDREQPAKAPAGQQMHCTGCTALPAMNAPAPVAELSPEAPMTIALAAFLAGIEPDIATPPPKLA